jgi:hypothetical protein
MRSYYKVKGDKKELWFEITEIGVLWICHFLAVRCNVSIERQLTEENVESKEMEVVNIYYFENISV